MLLYEIRNGPCVFAIGLLMDGEETQSFFVGDPVKTLKPLDFGGRNRRNLRLVDIKRGQAGGQRRIAAEMVERIDQCASCWKWFGFEYLCTAQPQCLGEPEEY